MFCEHIFNGFSFFGRFKNQKSTRHLKGQFCFQASIEAEKTKPKKEIKSRVSLLPPPAPKAPQKENKEGKLESQQSFWRCEKGEKDIVVIHS